MIDIRWLLPHTIRIQVWNNSYYSDLEDGKYILKVQLSEYTEADKVLIYVWEELFDTINKRIALRAWDTLHLEYSIYGEEQ